MYSPVSATVVTDTTGLPIRCPSLLTPAGHLMPLVNYLTDKASVRSLDWAFKVRAALLLFLRYAEANPNELNRASLFKNFALRLCTGTFDPKTGIDESWLGWRPRSAWNVKRILFLLSEFFDWLGTSSGVSEALEFNPRVPISAYDRHLADLAYQARRQQHMLGYTWAEENELKHIYATQARRAPDVNASLPPRFPDNRFEELIERGFKVGDTHDYRGILITLLLHAAGFRCSEPFHLYIQDVMRDPLCSTQALVRIYHPSEGAAPHDWVDGFGRSRTGTRSAYLKERYGLLPRTEMTGRKHAGWKGGLHEGTTSEVYKQAYWFEPSHGERFLYYWGLYLNQVAQFDRAHPFAFINMKNGARGDMYTQDMFITAHGRACERIGLQVKKAAGTTPHGHRHAYGKKLQLGDVDPRISQIFLHHSAKESQVVYQAFSASELRAALEAAAQRASEAGATRAQATKDKPTQSS